MKYKKGQIVPRWLGVTASDRKSQHKIKFGADVSIEGGVIFLESDGYAIFVPYDMTRMMKNGTRKNVKTVVSGVAVNCSRVVDGGGFTLEGKS